MDWLRARAKWCWDNLGNLAMLAGWAMSFALPAWAVRATNLLDAYAPASWVAAGLLGLLLMALCYASVARGAVWLITARARSGYYRGGDRINPLQPLFERQRIAIADLVSPFDPEVSGRTFINCELIGPANLLLLERTPAAMTITGNIFLDSDAVVIRADARAATAVVFADCRFINCRLYRVNLLFYDTAFDAANRAITGLNWITHPPQVFDLQPTDGSTNPPIEGP